MEKQAAGARAGAGSEYAAVANQANAQPGEKVLSARITRTRSFTPLRPSSSIAKENRSNSFQPNSRPLLLPPRPRDEAQWPKVAARPPLSRSRSLPNLGFTRTATPVPETAVLRHARAGWRLRVAVAGFATTRSRARKKLQRLGRSIRRIRTSAASCASSGEYVPTGTYVPISKAGPTTRRCGRPTSERRRCTAADRKLPPGPTGFYRRSRGRIVTWVPFFAGAAGPARPQHSGARARTPVPAWRPPERRQPRPAPDLPDQRSFRRPPVCCRRAHRW